MNINNKLDKILNMVMNLLLVIGVVVIAITITGCSRGKGLSDYNYVKSARVEYDGNVYEINKCVDEDTILIVENGKLKEVREKVKFSSPREYMVLKEVEKAINLDSGVVDEDKLDGVYEVGLDLSSSYIKYLKQEGWEEVLKAETDEFIEIYMQRDSGLKKRIIITDTFLVEDKVESFSYDGIDSYIL